MNLHPSLMSSCLATMPAYIKERFTIIKTELSLIETKGMYKEKFRLTTTTKKIGVPDISTRLCKVSLNSFFCHVIVQARSLTQSPQILQRLDLKMIFHDQSKLT